MLSPIMLRKKIELLMIIATMLFSQCTGRNDESKQKTSTYSSTTNDRIPAPAEIRQILTKKDSSKVFFIDKESILRDTLVEGKKRIRVSGDVFFDIHSKQLPLYLYTSLMHLEVLETPASFRVDAYDTDQGQAVEVLGGTIRIAKAYSSPFPEPDTLHANNLYMINKSIDLSEKETLDNDLLRRWWEKYKVKPIE